jgi:hypothetical protein
MRRILIQPLEMGRRSRRARFRRLARKHVPLLECCEQRTLLSTSTWIGGAHVNAIQTSGDPTAWSNPLNWLGGAPGPGDTLVFTANVSFSLLNPNTGKDETFTHPFNESPNDDTTASGGISIDSSWTGSITVENGVTLTFTGSGTWNGGTLATATGGTLLNSSSATLTLQNSSEVVIAGTFTNAGTVNVDGSAPIVMAGATFNNESGATFDIQSNQGLTFDESLANNFTNSGLLEQTVGTGTTDFITSLSNTGGTIDIQTGTFEWDGNDGVSTGGTFNASPGAVLQYGVENQSNTWTGTYKGGGGGHFVQNSAFDAEIAIGSSGATFDFDPGFYQWEGGDIAPANNTSAATLTNDGTISVVATQHLVVLSRAMTLDNFGTIDHTGADPFVFNSSAMINEPSGIYDFESDAGWVTSGGLTGTVTNKGLIEKTAGTGQSVISVFLGIQGGTLDAQTGTLIPWDAANQGNTGGGSTGGKFEAASGATIQFNAGDNSSATFTGTYTGSGGGQFVLNRDDLIIGAGGATFDFPSGFFDWIGSGELTATAGALTNTGFITVDTSNGHDAIFSGTLDNGTAANSGTITFQNSSGNNNALFFGGTVNNLAKSVINLSGIDGGSNPLLDSTVNNSGTINANSPSSVSISVLNNTGGTLDAQTGTFIPWNGNGAASTGGTFEAASGATIQYCPSGNFNNTFTGTYTGSGPGHFVKNSGDLVIGSGGATFDFPSGFFQWIGPGRLDATAGSLTNTGFTTVDTSNGNDALFSGTLDNSGTIAFQNSTKNGAAFIGGTVNNLAAGVINLSGNEGPNASLLDATVTNAGVINSNSPSSISIATLNNTGTVNVQSGTLNAFNVAQISGSTLTGGTWKVFGGSTLKLSSGAFGTTSLTTNNAVVLLDGAGSSLANFVGELATNGGSFTVQDGASFSTPGAFTNTGTIVIGNNHSVLTTNGNYTQSAGGALAIGLGGAGTGQFGKLAVAGTASVNGALNISLLGGFVPSSPQTFPIVTSKVLTGTFSNVTGTALPNKQVLVAKYATSGVTLGVAAKVVPPLVTVKKVQIVTNAQHQVTKVLITFSGAVSSTGADNLGTYRLATPGKGGSFTGKGAGTVSLKSASYSAVKDTVTLVPTKPFTLAKPVQLTVFGTGPNGLHDSQGRLIDGDHNGTAGGNAIEIL